MFKVDKLTTTLKIEPFELLYFKIIFGNQSSELQGSHNASSQWPTAIPHITQDKNRSEDGH